VSIHARQRKGVLVSELS